MLSVLGPESKNSNNKETKQKSRPLSLDPGQAEPDANWNQDANYHFLVMINF